MAGVKAVPGRALWAGTVGLFLILIIWRSRPKHARWLKEKKNKAKHFSISEMITANESKPSMIFIYSLWGGCIVWFKVITYRIVSPGHLYAAVSFGGKCMLRFWYAPIICITSWENFLKIHANKNIFLQSLPTIQNQYILNAKIHVHH